MAVFGTQNPFYVVSSGSMVPALQVYDIIVVRGNAPFEQVAVGDIIVFDRPSDHDRVIVHRVTAVTDSDPYTVRTQGDANPGPIPGTDYPITADEYIGTVEHVVPQVGFVTRIFAYQIGGVPLNYILIVIIVGAVIAKQALKPKTAGPRPYEKMLKDAKGRLARGGIDDRFSLEYARRGASMPSVDPGWQRAAELGRAEEAGRWDEYGILYEQYVAENLPGRLAEVRMQRAAARAHNDHVRALIGRGAPAYARVDPGQLDVIVAGGDCGQLRFAFARKEGGILVTADTSKLADAGGRPLLRPAEARCLPAGHKDAGGPLGEAVLEDCAQLAGAITRIEGGGLSDGVREFAAKRGIGL